MVIVKQSLEGIENFNDNREFRSDLVQLLPFKDEEN